jgi:hypothetical protein
MSLCTNLTAERSVTASRQQIVRIQGGGLWFLDAHEIPERDFSVVNVRFGSPCGLNSDISRGPRSATSGLTSLFDHFVGEREQFVWNFEAERF